MNPTHFERPVDSDPGFLEAFNCLDFVKVYIGPLEHNCPLLHLDHSGATLKRPGQLPRENEVVQNRT